MSANGKPSGSLAGKLMLSGALILASGAYAWRQGGAQEAPAAAQQPPAQKLAVLPASEPQAQGQPVPEPQAASTAPAPASPGKDEMPAAETEPPAAAPQAVLPAPPQAVSGDAPAPPAEPQDRPVLASNAPPAPPVQKAGRYADGDYTGRPADAVWGLIQVKVSIRGGAITHVECIDYPNHRRRSIQINDWALPMLEQEVIAAQSADVDIVTQATTTSVGYRQTLASALAQAQP